MRPRLHRLLGRLAGAAAASGLALAGLVVVASPASAAACSGTTGVTVVVDTGGWLSTRCASGDPSSATNALTAAGFSVTYPQQYPGSVVCRINGYPSSDPCVRMPPSDAYWAFFHATRGGSWVYSSTGAASYDPAPGTVVGFRFGSGQQPGIAPPAPTRTAAPAPTTTKPKPTTAAPKPSAPRATSGTTATPGSSTTAAAGPAPARPSPAPSASGPASASMGPSATSTDDASATASAASDLASAPVSAQPAGSGPGTLVVGGVLVALVAGGAGYAAWTRRGTGR